MLIEFVELNEEKERIVAKFKSFSEIPISLEKSKKPFPPITLKGSKWKILGKSKNLRAHGPGIHIKIKIEKI